ncbi:MAG: flagellar protein FlaG [Tissierellia bacterium]|nr:flagellar protein FlaG [Tissierellia bacterium]
MGIGESRAVGAGQTDREIRSANPPMKRENRILEREVIESIESANEQFIAYNRRFEFSIHDKTRHIMVKIIDVTTDEVIREIPPERILDIVAGLWELSGLLVDERI